MGPGEESSFGFSERSIGQWANLVSWKVVGRIFGFHWNAVRKAVKDLVEYGLEHRDLKEVVCIGVDEISRRKGHIYHTQVYDLTTPRLLWSGEKRKSETLEKFFKDLGHRICDAVGAVCCDMWAPYIDVIKRYPTTALLVFDKSHIVRHVMTAVHEVRKEKTRKLKANSLELLRETKHLWLKNPWNLTENQKVRLSDLEKVNLKTHRPISSRKPSGGSEITHIPHGTRSTSVNGSAGRPIPI
jgi:transposase